jgi:hypothetical protein
MVVADDEPILLAEVATELARGVSGYPSLGSAVAGGWLKYVELEELQGGTWRRAERSMAPKSPVAVRDLQAAGAGGRPDDEDRDRRRPVLGLLRQRFLDFGGCYQAKTRTTKADAE